MQGVGVGAVGALGAYRNQGISQGWAWGDGEVNVDLYGYGGVLGLWGAPIVLGCCRAWREMCGPGQQRLTLSLCMYPQVAGMPPGRHLVPAEAAGGAEDWLLRLLLGTEHQPHVPAGAADSGGYLWRSHNWVRLGWMQSSSGWQ